MKKLTRFAAFALSAAMLVSVTGCSKNTGAGTDNTVVWYMMKPIDNIDHQKSVEEAVNKLIAEKLDAKVHFNLIDSASWDQKTKLLGASQEGVDLIMTADWTNKLTDNVKNGAFMPLDDLIKKYGQDIVKKVDKRAWDAVTFDGKIYAVPSQMPYSSPQSFVFKKELVDKYNFDYKNCKTLDDLEPFLETVKQNEPGITPLLATPGDIPLPYLDNKEGVTSGIMYDFENDKVVTRYSEEDDIFLNYGRKLHEFYEKGYIAKDAPTKTGYTSEAKSGKYAVMHHAGSATADGSKSTSLYGFDCVESIILYPMITTSSFTSGCTAISINCKKPELAMQLLNLIWSDPEISNTIAYGVEGQDYRVVSGKGTDHIKVKANEGKKQKWAIWHNWIGPLFDQWDSNWNTKESLDEMQYNNEHADVSPINGFSFDPDPVATEVATVSSVLGEVNAVVYTGSMKDYDEYVDKVRKRLEQAGVSKIKAEVERQLADWRKTQKKD